MQIIHHLTIDMARQLPAPPIGAVQNDANTRAVEISLLENGEPWNVPEGITAAVAFRKPDRTKGLYDRLPDGSVAVTIEGSTVTAILAPQILSCAGEVSAAVVFHDADLNQLATFPFTLRVAANPAAGKQVSNDYYQYSTMEDVSQAVEDALASLEHEKQDFLTQAREALQTVHETATEDAPAIVCKAVGQTITVTDAANRPISGLTLYGKTVQNGTPTPASPVDTVSLGAGGTITVSVTGPSDEPVQTVTASTPNGLPGIDVTDRPTLWQYANITDSEGRKWVCDYIDFARGVYAKRLVTSLIDMRYSNEDSKGIFRGVYPVSFAPLSSYPPLLCNCFARAESYSDMVANDLLIGLNSSGIPLVKYKAFTGDVAGFTAWAVNNPIYVCYPQKTPIETPLSAEELAQYAALHSNKPTTTVFNDANASMKLDYVADTKAYIDNKFAAISAAMLNA